MTPSRLIRWSTVAAGLVTILLGIIIALIMPTTANLSEGFRTPIIAFEFAQTEEDLNFLRDSDPSGAENRDKIDRGHRWDMIFPIAYGIFLTLLLVQLAQSEFQPAWLFALFALLAIPFDIWENTILLSITRSLENGGTGAEFLNMLYIATWLKWGAIGLGAIGVGWGYWEKGKWWSAGLAIATGLVTGIAWWLNSDPFWVELMALMVFAFFFWFVILHCLQVWNKQ